MEANASLNARPEGWRNDSEVMEAKLLGILEAIPGSCAMRVFFNFMAALQGIIIPVSAQTSAPPSSAIKVKIEAAENNRKLLLNKLNEERTKHGLKFELGDEEFVYRIEFDISYLALPAGSASGTYASAKVYDGQGTSLFSLERNSRSPFVNQDARVATAVAKEIIKRLLKAPAHLPSQSATPPTLSKRSRMELKFTTGQAQYERH